LLRGTINGKTFWGRVEKSNKREYGRALLHKQKNDVLLKDVMEKSQVWMSHADTILELPKGFELLATTESIPIAAFRKNGATDSRFTTHHSPLTTPSAAEGLPKAQHDFPLYGLQFHPEVYHSIEGKKILHNFLVNVCGCKQDWTPAHFISDSIAQLKAKIGDRKVVMALSGGVDSTVAATLISRAIGGHLYGIFVDNGVLRKDEFETVLATYKKLD
jgi:GMP synthase (glutamine-hydrolysing)